eukprot:1158310-Pelagomonas_calceolata.AAC.15
MPPLHSICCSLNGLPCGVQVQMPDNQPVNLRIGLHTGPCVSGLVGLEVPKWSVFGDTVNTSARMEQTAVPGTIQISNATKRLLPDLDIGLKHNGAVAMKVSESCPLSEGHKLKVNEQGFHISLPWHFNLPCALAGRFGWHQAGMLAGLWDVQHLWTTPSHLVSNKQGALQNGLHHLTKNALHPGRAQVFAAGGLLKRPCTEEGGPMSSKGRSQLRGQQGCCNMQAGMMQHAR